MDNVSPFKVVLSKQYRPAFLVLCCILLGNQGYYFLRAHWPIGFMPLNDIGILDNPKLGSIMQITYACNSKSQISLILSVWEIHGRLVD